MTPYLIALARCAVCSRLAIGTWYCGHRLCRKCFGGIVASCPVCGVGLPPSYMREYERKRREGDRSAFGLVAYLLVGAALLALLAWAAS